MSDFYKRALKKIEKLTDEQRRDLLVSAAEGINRLETVLDSLHYGILVCDENHCLVMANKYARHLFNLSASDLTKIPLWMAVRNEQIVEFFEETLLSGERILNRDIDMDVQGRQRLLSISMLPLVQNLRITGTLVYLEDITEERGRQARLRRAENLASLTTLAAGVAHEIKNPLGSISIHLQLMQKALGKAELSGNAAQENADLPIELLHKYIGILNEEVERLNHIVVDFLFAVRPMSLELRKGNINTLVGELMDFINPELEALRIQSIYKPDAGIPSVMIDERYMKQVLLNLIKNSQAAMPEGGTLTVATGFSDSEVKISITDTGTGISAANMAKLFDPYFTTRENGTGLGLTTVYKIVREHLGEVNVQSKEGEGSCFTISLPAIQEEQRLIGWNAAASFENAQKKEGMNEI